MKRTIVTALLALVLGSALANAAPVRGDAQWPTDFRTENSGDFQLSGR
jgi:hypothetical protein